MGNTIAGVLAGIVAFALLLFAVAWATGAPSAPTASLSGSINPSQAQSFTVTLTTQVASTAPPNSIWQLGTNFVYTVSESNANGGTTIVAQNQHVGGSVSGSHWPVYTVTATFAVSTVAICSSGCAGVASNLTVTAQALTWGGALASPNSTTTFSNIPGYQNVPTAGPTNYASYYQQALGTGLLGVAFIGVAVVMTAGMHKFAELAAIVAGIAGLIVLVLL